MPVVNQIEPNVDMPVIRYGGVAYPVLFAVASIRRWAEHMGQSFVEVTAGWAGHSLSDEDLVAMLRIALEAGERRRRLFESDENHLITDELLAALFETYHLDELLGILTVAWDQPPGRASDLPIVDLLPAGEEE